LSDSLSLDRKVKFTVPAKTNIALKHLKEQLSLVLASRMRNKGLEERQIPWAELAMIVLGGGLIEAEK